MEEKLREYAKLLIELGVNVQPGQTLVIASPGRLRALRAPVRRGGLRRRLPRGGHELEGRLSHPRALSPRRRRRL